MFLYNFYHHNYLFKPLLSYFKIYCILLIQLHRFYLFMASGGFLNLYWKKLPRGKQTTVSYTVTIHLLGVFCHATVEIYDALCKYQNNGHLDTAMVHFTIRKREPSIRHWIIKYQILTWHCPHRGFQYLNPSRSKWNERKSHKIIHSSNVDYGAIYIQRELCGSLGNNG